MDRGRARISLETVPIEIAESKWQFSNYGHKRFHWHEIKSFCDAIGQGVALMRAQLSTSHPISEKTLAFKARFTLNFFIL